MKVDQLFDVAKDGVVLRVHVQPGAGKESIVGTHGDALKVRVVAPPVSGRANDALCKLLAGELGVDASSLEITSGEKGRLKRVKITGLSAAGLEAKLKILVGGASARRPRQ